jgi:hypothetical protein
MASKALLIGGILAVVIIIVLVVVSTMSGSSAASSSSAAGYAPPSSAGSAPASSSSSGAPSTVTTAKATPSGPAVRTYYFYPGMDSNLGDIENSGLADNIAALKSRCDALPGCQGFNTNAWMKKTILPRAQWNQWTSDPNKGLYTVQQY